MPAGTERQEEAMNFVKQLTGARMIRVCPFLLAEYATTGDRVIRGCFQVMKANVSEDVDA